MRLASLLSLDVRLTAAFLCSASLLQYHDAGRREQGKGCLAVSDIDSVRAVPTDCAAFQILSSQRVILTFAVPTKLNYSPVADKWDKELEAAREEWIDAINSLILPA